MTRHLPAIAMAIAFDIYWTLVVLFRERGLIIWLALAILAWLMLPRPYRVRALLLAAAGCAMDAVWAWSGLVAFHGSTLLPLWMAALWLMFATLWTGLTRNTPLPPFLLTLLASTGGPLAYLLGEHLGAMTFTKPDLTVAGWMAAGWLMLIFSFQRLTGKRS